MQRVERSERACVTVEFEGKLLTAFEGDSVAAALLAAHQQTLRTTPASDAKRGPYCMMGVCFECLVEIDGVGNRQACMIEVHEGMVIKQQRGAVDIENQYASRIQQEPKP